MRFPIKYEEPLFRPPSEAYSLIFQATGGCSWNKCTFCEMYTTKSFSIKKEDDLLREIQEAAAILPDTRKVFLADGDALVLSSQKLLKILSALKKFFPRLNRVSAYALPRNILAKTEDELEQLYNAGLKLLYIGIESGDDTVLEAINKGETFDSTAKGIKRVHAAGIKTSVMILLGLGGLERSREHAIHSAHILNETQPAYASTLALSFPFGKKHFQNRYTKPFGFLSAKELLEEQLLLLKYCELNETVFRSDHASNYIALKGILNRDKSRLIEQLEYAITNPRLWRKEWMRGL